MGKSSSRKRKGTKHTLSSLHGSWKFSARPSPFRKLIRVKWTRDLKKEDILVSRVCYVEDGRLSSLPSHPEEGHVGVRRSFGRLDFFQNFLVFGLLDLGMEWSTCHAPGLFK